MMKSRGTFARLASLCFTNFALFEITFLTQVLGEYIGVVSKWNRVYSVLLVDALAEDVEPPSHVQLVCPKCACAVVRGRSVGALNTEGCWRGAPENAGRCERVLALLVRSVFNKPSLD